MPDSAAQARALVDVVSFDLDPELIENVRLLVSELVTNAILHGPRRSGGEIHLRIETLEDLVRVDVEDPGGGFQPRVRLGSRDDPGGWGLVLVGRLADRWGIDGEPRTHVWFEIDRTLSDPARPFDERDLVDAMGAAVVATNPHGTITRWNRRAEEIFGFGPAEALGRPVAEVLLAREDPRTVRAILRRIRDGVAWQSEWHAQTKKSEPVDVSVSSSPVLATDGTPLGVVAVFADISPRVRADRRLSGQHAVARVLASGTNLEDATLPILTAIGRTFGWEIGSLYVVDRGRGRLRCIDVWIDEPGRAPAFVSATRAFAPVIGLGLPGRVWEEAGPVWVPDLRRDANFPRRALAATDGIGSGIGFPVELRGEVTGVLEFFAPAMERPDAEMLEILVTLGRQIGQAIERFQTRGALEVSEARKTAIFNAARDAIVSMDARGTIVDFNPAAERMFGHRREEVLGAELASVIIPERLRDRHRSALEQFVELRQPTILGRRVEMSALRADGSELPVELTITLVESPGDLSFTAFIRDVSEDRSVEHQRSEILAMERVARAKAEAMNDRLTFLADASIVFASSLNYRKTLSKLAKLAVPRIADFCSIEMVEADGSIRSLEIVHSDPEMIALATEYRERFHPDDSPVIPRVIESARAELYADISMEGVEAAIPDPEERELIRRLGPRSAMTVPLIARGRAMGAITFLSTDDSGRRFEPADLELAEDLARRAALSIDNARLYEERSHVARTLQRSLLPPELPEVPGVEVAALYEPAAIERNEVGGDFYDVFELAPGSWSIAIGDVCGKGVAAAALTGFVRHTIRAVALHEKSPSSVLSTMSEALRREDGERFCTVAFARLDLEPIATLTLSCGGHPLPFVVRADGAVQTVGAPGSLLGILDVVDLEERSVELAPGDAVVFFTDGLIDQRRRPALDERGLASLLARCAGMGAAEISAAVAEAVADPEGLAPDDVAIVVARVRP